MYWGRGAIGDLTTDYDPKKIPFLGYMNKNLFPHANFLASTVYRLKMRGQFFILQG